MTRIRQIVGSGVDNRAEIRGQQCGTLADFPQHALNIRVDGRIAGSIQSGLDLLCCDDDT